MGSGSGGSAISIHAPHTGRDILLVDAAVGADISIHAPHTGRDLCKTLQRSPARVFQSTRPIRGATFAAGQLHQAQPISIHAPHTGRDLYQNSCHTSQSYFNPRAPYGARHPLPAVGSYQPHFNPRAPYGARPSLQYRQSSACCISIHAPHTGRDAAQRSAIQASPHFNPRAPYGARRGV